MNNTELLYGKLVPFVADILKYKNELVTSLEKNEDYKKKIQLLETTMIFYNDEKKRLFSSDKQQDVKSTPELPVEKKDITEEVNISNELFWDAFTFNSTTEQPVEEKAASSSSEDSDSDNTESEYEFSGDDKEETEKIEAIFEKSKIKLKKVRQSKGFIINRKTNFMHV